MSGKLSSTTQLFGHHIETIERVQRRFTKKLPGCVNLVMMKDCLVYVCIAWNYDVYLLIWCGVTKYYLVLLKCLLLCLLLRIFFCIQHMLPN